MNLIIVLSLVIALFHYWLVPMVLNRKNAQFLLSNRDGTVDESVWVQRAKRASNNLQESLPAFLALSLLAIFMQIDVIYAASLWLICRVIYLPSYILSFNLLRTLSWAGSLFCLVYMCIQLV